MDNKSKILGLTNDNQSYKSNISNLNKQIEVLNANFDDKT